MAIKRAWRPTLCLILLVLLAIWVFGFGCTSPSTPPASSKQQDSQKATQVDKQERDQRKFPTSPVSLIVPWDPGGTSDLQARALASIAGQFLNQAMVVVNKSGGVGVTGSLYVAKAKPDGYTLGAISHQVIVSQYTSVEPTDIKSYDYVVGISQNPFILVVRQDAPWKTFGEFVDFANKNPGTVKHGTSGVGSSVHVAAAAIEQATKSKFDHIPYTGGYASTIAALMSGEAQAATLPPGDVEGLVKEGKLRALACTGSTRSNLLPDVPTLKELGFDIAYGAWTGVLAPKGVPKDILSFLSDSLDRAMSTPEFQKYLVKAGLERFGLKLEELRDFVVKDDTLNHQLIEKLGLKVK